MDQWAGAPAYGEQALYVADNGRLRPEAALAHMQ